MIPKSDAEMCSIRAQADVNMQCSKCTNTDSLKHTHRKRYRHTNKHTDREREIKRRRTEIKSGQFDQVVALYVRWCPLVAFSAA